MSGRWVALALAGLWASAPGGAQAAAPVPEDIPVALLIDVATGQTLFAREERRRFVPASVTKVMTAYTAFRLVEQGRLRLDARFAYPARLEEEWYNEGSSMFLRAGDRPTMGQLLLGVTTVSGNDASVALAEATAGSLEGWVTLMNENAAALGMVDTHFASANGYPDGGRTYTSARDLARLATALTQRYPGLYRRFFCHRQFTWGPITQTNHDPITGRVPGADGIKTGYTNEAGYTFVGSAQRGGRRLVMVLAGAPSAGLRDRTARDLINWGFEAFSMTTIFPEGAMIARAEVQQGDSGSVAMVAPRAVRVALPPGAALDPAEGWSMAIAYRGPVVAPVAAGQQLGVLRVMRDGRVIAQTPLVASEAVGEAGPLRRLFNGVAGWLS